MPASAHEIENAVGEGVQLHPGWGPVRIGADGETTFQFCEQVHETGIDPKFDTTRQLTLEGDHVILATGQGTDLNHLDGSAVETTHGFILTDPKTLMTKVPGVFAGGDVEHGPRTVVEAIRSGKIAVAAIRRLAARASPWTTDRGARPVRRAEVLPLTVSGGRAHAPARVTVMPERTVEEVVGVGNYVQIEEGLTDAMARDEARRCLRCDVCIGCGLCMAACSEMGVDALRMGKNHLRLPAPPTSTSPGPPTSASAAAPAPSCAPPGPSTFRCDRDSMRSTVITGTTVCNNPC